MNYPKQPQNDAHRKLAADHLIALKTLRAARVLLREAAGLHNELCRAKTCTFSARVMTHLAAQGEGASAKDSIEGFQEMVSKIAQGEGE